MGRWAFAGLVALLGVAYAANVAGPPPPSVKALTATAIAGAAVTLVWSWWADAHRDVVH